ncbi:carboxypeptidase B-like [Anopheles stephensi]|uniref:carboxypeptidase B-like n=1 Tax=Anopheles stephensi TaxID=30069 RepID=UPI0016588A8C|nr:carboxypeptidase B-like [Anopheles stephensi]
MVAQRSFNQHCIWLWILCSCITFPSGLSIPDPKAAITRFMSYNETNDFMFTLARLFPTRVQVKSIGLTAEGRDINMIAINYLAPKNVTIVANLNAREWAAMTSVVYFIVEIVYRPQKYPDTLHLRWNIIPMANPDGYEYTMNQNRYWNKNRSPQSDRSFGVYLNANFAYLWQNSKPNAPSDDFYRGPGPFSERESNAIGGLLSSTINSTILYVDVHSSAQSIFYPWSYTEQPAANLNKSRSIAQAGAKAVKAKFGIIYDIGTWPELRHYELYGTSVDYCNSLSINACMWLDISKNGYELEVDSIREYGEQAVEAFSGMAKQAEMFSLS